MKKQTFNCITLPLLLMVTALLISPKLSAQAIEELYVGQTTYLILEVPDEAIVYSASWSTSDPNITVSNGNEYSAQVEINHYFSGYSTVECYYAYYTINVYNGNRVFGTSTRTFGIHCKTIDAILSSDDLELKVGQSSTLTYKLSPSRYNPYTVQWSSTNNSVATVSSTGTVMAVAAGKTRIKLDPIVGPAVYCDVTVTSAGNNDGNKDEDEDSDKNEEQEQEAELVQKRFTTIENLKAKTVSRIYY